ncbi:MAG TPA: hypothetical protein VMZ71_04615, partial [Gemmataceae bacterium]|nr:hypothetical protein [Gemmataceae bacterium]
RGLIVVGRNCGEFAGASMIAGSIFILGEAGPRLGAGMKRGTIVAGRVAELPPSFRYSCDFRPSFLRFYAAKFREWEANPTDFLHGEMRCYRGDLLHGGTGEVLTPAEPLRSPGTT